MAVICRILGIPVLVVADALAAFRPGLRLRLNTESANVSIGEMIHDAPLAPARGGSVAAFDKWPLRYQLSVVDDPRLITRANAVGRWDVEQFFLREEFIWVALNLHPLAFVEKYGGSAVTAKLVAALLPHVSQLMPGQFLNFRSLDIRSDEWSQFGGPTSDELNPQLGFHGVRQLLSVPDYLVSEMQAVDQLYDKGFTNIIYSLPFVTLESELAAILELRDRRCSNPIKVGLFVETPAAVYELPHLLKHQPFAVYVGTKDLSQLILAADRGNAAVAHIFSVTSRPVLTALKSIIADCYSASTSVFVFAFPDDLEFLLASLPGLERVSLAASDYHRMFGG